MFSELLSEARRLYAVKDVALWSNRRGANMPTTIVCAGPAATAAQSTLRRVLFDREAVVPVRFMAVGCQGMPFHVVLAGRQMCGQRNQHVRVVSRVQRDLLCDDRCGRTTGGRAAYFDTAEVRIDAFCEVQR